MKYSVNANAARIAATMSLFEALGLNEFTGKQYDKMRNAQTREQAKGTCWAGNSSMRWVPNEYKPYSLNDMREDGFVKVARQEPIEIMVKVEIHRVIDRNQEEVFRGTWDECREWVGDCRRDFMFRWAETEQRPMPAVRNYYTIDRDAFAEFLVSKFVDLIN
jgi:hypothetical protein